MDSESDLSTLSDSSTTSLAKMLQTLIMRSIYYSVMVTRRVSKFVISLNICSDRKCPKECRTPVRITGIPRNPPEYDKYSWAE